MRTDIVGNQVKVGDVIFRKGNMHEKSWINLVVKISNSGNPILVCGRYEYKSLSINSSGSTGYKDLRNNGWVNSNSFSILYKLDNLDPELKSLFNEKRKELGLEPIK